MNKRVDSINLMQLSWSHWTDKMFRIFLILSVLIGVYIVYFYF
jgi:hypothetical protein